MIPLYSLDPAAWEEFKIKREPGETEHWKVGHFTVDPLDAERLYHLVRGRDCGVGNFTALYYRRDFAPYAKEAEEAYPKHSSEWAPMMSDSKAEILDHFAFMDRAVFVGEDHGSVLITGLGLGMVAEACLNFGCHVTVVERDKEVIDLVAHQIDHPHLTIVEADAFDWEPSAKFDVAWHDIWPTISAQNIPEMHRMKRHYKPFVRHWQGSWAYEQCKYMAREETRTDPTGFLRWLRTDPRVSVYAQWVMENPEQAYAHMLAKQKPEEGNAEARHLFHAITGRTAPGERRLP